MILVTEKGELKEIKQITPRPLVVGGKTDAVCVMFGSEEIVLLTVSSDMHRIRCEKYDEEFWVITCFIEGYQGRFETEMFFGEQLRPIGKLEKYATLIEAMGRKFETTLVLERVIKTIE